MISHVLFILRDGPLVVGKEALVSLSLVMYAHNIRSMSRDRECRSACVLCRLLALYVPSIRNMCCCLFIANDRAC